MAQAQIVAQGNNQLQLRLSLKQETGRQRKYRGCRASQKFELKTEDLIEGIKKKLVSVDLSVSSYDTAWVAMVPASKGLSLNNQKRPLFPKCLDWILQNQNTDGSWSSSSSDPLLLKDSLSSTLACLLALQTWQVGQHHIDKGLDFIGSKSSAIYDKQQLNPIGFDLVFPGMITQASKLGLHLPLNSGLVDQMLRDKDLQLRREKPSSFAYVAEALGESYQWQDAIKHQRSNGSFFNSPATTAAALIYSDDEKSSDYLKSVLSIYGMAVPTVYPYNIHARLCMVDTIERLGISRYFKLEIENILEETYSYWQQGSEDIFMDLSCMFMAFRLLRLTGYEIHSNVLEGYMGEELFLNKAGIQFTDMNTILELYKASRITLFEEEPILEKINGWTGNFLRNKLCTESIFDKRFERKVKNDLEHSINIVDRYPTKKYIESYNTNEYTMLKSSIRSSNTTDMNLLTFAIHDFNKCQAVMRDELAHLEQWIKENKLDTLKWDKCIVNTAYVAFAGYHFAPDVADARLVWTKNCILGTLIDDIFDIDGSEEELQNIMDLVERWDEHSTIGYRSKEIEIIFSVLHRTIDEYAAKASVLHDRCIRGEFIQVYVDFVRSFKCDLEAWKSEIKPELNEHVQNGATSSGTALYLMGIYFLGLKLPSEVIKCEEYDTLFYHTGALIRFVNDRQGYLREEKERKLNCYDILLKLHAGSPTALEDSRKDLETLVEYHRRAVLRLFVQRKSSLVPKEVRQIFWNIVKTSLDTYEVNDEYRLPKVMLDVMKEIFYQPIPLPQIEE